MTLVFWQQPCDLGGLTAGSVASHAVAPPRIVSGVAATTVIQTDEIPLHKLAAARNICFGSEITIGDLIHSQNYTSLIVRECAIITPGLEAKWPATEPVEGQFALAPLDAIVGFAQTNKLRIHMHNLIWRWDFPLDRSSYRPRPRAAIMRHHIAMVAGRYRGQVESWDVVNEPVDQGGRVPLKAFAPRHGAARLGQISCPPPCARRVPPIPQRNC